MDKNKESLIKKIEKIEKELDMVDIMKVIVGYYEHRNKEDIDITDSNFVRMNLDKYNNNYIDIRFDDGSIKIEGSSKIKIISDGGCNCVRIELDKEY